MAKGNDGREKWIARNIWQGLDSPQPMTAMAEKKSPG